MALLDASEEASIRERLTEFGYTPEEIAIVLQCFAGQIDPHPSHDWAARYGLKDLQGELVDITEYGLVGNSFYYDRREKYDLSFQKLRILGIEEEVMVSKNIIPYLLGANGSFAEDGYSMLIKEGYRSRLAYAYIYVHKMLADGQKAADRIYNPKDRPHASGLAVDVVLFKDGRQVMMRDGKDDPYALFYGHYHHNEKNGNGKSKSKADQEKHALYSFLQEYLVATMRKYGFDITAKGEYFHFNHNTFGAPGFTAKPIRPLKEIRKSKLLKKPQFL